MPTMGSDSRNCAELAERHARMAARLSALAQATESLPERSNLLQEARRALMLALFYVRKGEVEALRESGVGRRRTDLREIEPLTLREMEVAQRLTTGASNPEIGQWLGIGGQTVGTHVEHILAKLRLRTRGEAIAWAVRNLPEWQGEEGEEI